jgi:hypothetical protein
MGRPCPQGSEPAVGNGAIVRAVQAHKPGGRTWRCFDIRDVSKEVEALGVGASFEAVDFRQASEPCPADVYITNPPFSLAEDFAHQCLHRAGTRGHVILFLRLAFLESNRRAAFHRDHPSDIYPLARRPKTGLNKHGKLGSDSSAYAWFVWGPGRGGRWYPPIGALLD